MELIIILISIFVLTTALGAFCIHIENELQKTRSELVWVRTEILGFKVEKYVTGAATSKVNKE